MRFFTVPDGKAARQSVVWTIGFIGLFTLLVTIIGFGARAILGGSEQSVAAVGTGGNLAAPLLAQALGGGVGTTGGDIALALFSAAAFATILAVVSGLVLASASTVAHDVWASVIKRGQVEEDAETRVARAASIGMAVIAMAATLAIGSGFNVSVLVSMAFVFAASANFPTLLFALTWRRFNTTGAVTGVVVGCIASVVMIVLSPPVWPGPDSQGSPSPFIFPGLVTIPIGFIGCWLGTMLSKAETGSARARYDELLVRSETGLGSEAGSGRFTREPAAAAAAR